MGNCELLLWIILGNQIIQETGVTPKGGIGHTVGVGGMVWIGFFALELCGIGKQGRCRDWAKSLPCVYRCLNKTIGLPK